MKVLNLYAGIGGNRKLWNGVDCTAVEIEPKIAKIYQDFFPNDKVIVADAHQYLLEHFKEFDFIWSSPPCPTHSRINTDSRHKARYPDIYLYQEIILLGNNWFKGKWVVENVIPYYEPLLRPTNIIDRHCFWSNFNIAFYNFKPEKPIAFQTGTNGRYGFNLKGIKIDNKRQILRNLVNPEIAKHVFDCAFKLQQETLMEVSS
ncbi:MAG: DNA cytosine methyltransferase [Actinobacteria bacterium]|nr:DNA cytosine methyltransferase [Actinomycetota bacterium]MBE3122574.1 DNA cytosine methyltransferase [Thermoplasmata archaeon]